MTPTCRRRSAVAGIALWCVTAGSAAAQNTGSIFDEDPTVAPQVQIPDQLESVNRAIFRFNDHIYKIAVRPISRGYSNLVCAPIRRGIGHFFHNLGFPTRFMGNVFEGRLRNAGIETGRFLINTVTSLGFACTADGIQGFQERPSDLGLAFGTWGVGHGTYVVLPILGPTSLRDGVGLGLSGYFLSPLRYLSEWEERAALTGLDGLNQSPELMNAYLELKSGSVDPYIALRDAYASQRSRQMSHPPDARPRPITGK